MLENELIKELIKEKRSAKRWQNFRFLIGLLFFVLVLFAFISNQYVSIGPGNGSGYVSLIRLDGMIDSGRDFSAETVLPKLKEAFSDTSAKGVVLNINSGGGAPVQASIIHDAVLLLKRKYNKKVVVVGEDMLASGAYYVAVAADKIYVNPNTITGSIGVIMRGFGFPDLIKKLGVERRVYTAGSNKDRLDPFLPQSASDIEKIKQVINEVHGNFNQVVLEGREGKLHGDPNELFSGDFWSGQTALKLGLVDGLGNINEVLQKEFNVSQYKEYNSSKNYIKSFMAQMSLYLGFLLNSDTQLLEKI